MEGEVAERVQRLRERIAYWADQSGRDPGKIEILGATKSVPPQRIEEAYQAGIRLFGENRVQEAEAKIPLVQVPARWHMIGHLQRNKVKKAVQLFEGVESVDRPELVEELEKRLAPLGKRIEVLIEVNTSGEPQKHGLPPEDEKVIALAEKVLAASPLELRGLMTLGPYPPGERRSRRAFALLRELRDRLTARLGISLPVLSMGMSEDFPWAILEGATRLRLGRALFGERR